MGIKMPSALHEKQNLAAAKWAKKKGFPLVGTNITASYSRERVDVIGFRASCSLMIESKVSRSDFFADAKKPERQCGGVGNYRYYITPVDMVSVEELPQGWGLLFFDGKKVIEIDGVKGNYFPSFGDSMKGEAAGYVHDVDAVAERSMLFSLARRLAKGESILR
jgi:hypothetical protein